MRRLAVAAVLVAAASPVPAHSAHLCGWFVETAAPGDVHEVEFWLQSDERVSFLYSMSGKGFVADDGSGSSYSPGSGTFSLEPGEPRKVWSFGATLAPKAHIDIVGEIHVTPKDIFSDAPTPLIASFPYRRAVAEAAIKPGPEAAKRQCVSAVFPSP